MPEFTIEGKTYRPEITHRSVVAAKRLTGKGFFKLWHTLIKAQARVLDDDEDALDEAMQLGMELMLVALYNHHGDELQDTAAIAELFPDQKSFQAAAAATGEAADAFFNVDPSLKQQLEAVAEPKPKKKRTPRSSKGSASRRKATSRVTDSQPTAASTSDSPETKP